MSVNIQTLLKNSFGADEDSLNFFSSETLKRVGNQRDYPNFTISLILAERSQGLRFSSLLIGKPVQYRSVNNSGCI